MIDNDYSDDDDDDKGDPIDNDMKIQRQQCWQGNPREGWIHPRPAHHLIIIIIIIMIIFIIIIIIIMTMTTTTMPMLMTPSMTETKPAMNKLML